MSEYHLRIGNKLTGLVIRPDDRYDQMWRIHYQGKVSDMVNLTRAKDAAVGWVRPRGLGGTEKSSWDRRQTSREG